MVAVSVKSKNSPLTRPLSHSKPQKVEEASWSTWFYNGLKATTNGTYHFVKKAFSNIENSVHSLTHNVQQGFCELRGDPHTALNLEVVNSLKLEDGRTAVVVKFCNGQRVPAGFCNALPNELKRLDLSTGVISANSTEINFPDHTAYAQIVIATPRHPYTHAQLNATVNELWGRGCALEALTNDMLLTVKNSDNQSGKFLIHVEGFPISLGMYSGNTRSIGVFQNPLSPINTKCAAPGPPSSSHTIHSGALVAGIFSAFGVVAVMLLYFYAKKRSLFSPSSEEDRLLGELSSSRSSNGSYSEANRYTV